MGKPKHTAGIALYRRPAHPGLEPTVLLVHPVGAREWGTWSIPKGHGEKGESLKKTAVRETAEEVAILVSPSLLRGEPGRLYRKDPRRSLYYWLFNVTGHGFPDVFELERLQLTEIDAARFVPLSEAQQRLTQKQVPLLSIIELAARS